MRSDFIFDRLSDNEVKNFEIKINEENYFFRGIFMNPDASVVTVSKPTVKRLIIKDNIFKPFLDASVFINDESNAFERTTKGSINTTGGSIPDINGFKYRGDGRDVFFLEILPVEGEINPHNKNSQEFNRVFGFRNVFTCNNDETVNEGGKEYRKFDLIDFDETRLKQRKLQYSSVDSITLSNELSSIAAVNLSNEQRECQTGISMKDILKKCLNKNDEEIFFKEDGNILNFEDGLSKIFYTSNSSSYAIDDLQYMYKHHVSNNGRDFAFLKKDNYEGKYTLESADSIFNRAYIKAGDGIDAGGVYNIEKVLITGSKDGSTPDQRSIKTPSMVASFGEKSKVLNYRFFNTPAETYNEKINTKIVHSYDNENKKFLLRQKESNIINAKDVFTKNYVSKMKGKNDLPAPSLITTQTKTSNINYQDVYSLYKNEDVMLGKGLNELLKDGLLTNIGVELTLKGQLFRRSGRFISIERAENYVDNDFDKKFLGIYFILEVSTIIQDDNDYMNNIIAVKTYFFDDLKFNENVE
tara:strand:- start:1313 stop:2893 length:1581 start_codon:yes stop_codon:yes gene_type:complete